MKNRFQNWALPLIFLAASAGCASWPPRAAAPPSVSEQRAVRSQRTIQEFETERSKVQLEAALDRWQLGDIAGCETSLRNLLERDPSNLEARLRLAELAWSCDDLSTAEADYRQALAQSPDREDIQEALALVMEAGELGQ